MKQQLVNQELNFIGKELKDGHLYLKFYVADSSLNPAIGQLAKESLPKVMPTGVSRPYVVTDGKTKFPGNNPWHPFSNDPNPTLEKEIAFARDNYGIGECVMMTPFSELKRGAAVNPELAALGIMDDGWFAVMDVTDPTAKQSFIDDDGLIPPQISIGFLVHEQDRHKMVINNYDIAHFAACPKGSYGDKTHYWKSCIGEKGICLDALRGAAAASKDFAIIGSQKDVKSNLENIKKIDDENNSYDVDVDESKNNMSANEAITDSKDQKEIPGSKVDESKKESKNEGQEESKEKPAQKQTNNNSDVSDKSEKAESDNKNSDSDVKKELAELKASIEAKEAKAARKEELKKMIPTELFKNMQEWESEIETRLTQNLSDEVIKEIYDSKMAALKLSNMKAEPIGYNELQPSNSPFNENEQSTASAEGLGVHRGAAKGDNEGAEMIAKSLLLCSQYRSIKPERSN